MQDEAIKERGGIGNEAMPWLQDVQKSRELHPVCSRGERNDSPDPGDSLSACWVHQSLQADRGDTSDHFPSWGNIISMQAGYSLVT
jgi:hypothetical protein